MAKEITLIIRPPETPDLGPERFTILIDDQFWASMDNPDTAVHFLNQILPEGMKFPRGEGLQALLDPFLVDPPCERCGGCGHDPGSMHSACSRCGGRCRVPKESE